MRYIWRCHKCGASGTSTSLCDVKCDVCGSEIDTRDMQKYIQPAGFSVDFNAAVNNNVSVQRYINICEPLVTAHNTLNSYLGLPYVKYKNDKEGSVIHYSNGGGEGYILCLECGRMVANNKKNREEFKKRHYRLRSGVYCYAENIFPFDADIDEQVAKIGQWLPNVSGDTYPTRIFYTKSK